jgi:hypothetical protein
VGFAYDVTGRGRTIVRAGFGIMYERIQGNDVYNNAGTVPLAASVNFNNVSLSAPTAPVATGVPNAGAIPVNNVTGLDRTHYMSPTSTQFSLGVQQSIGKSFLDVKYVGTQNRHQNYYTETNLVDPSLLPALQADSKNYNADVPFLGYTGIRQSVNGANGDYNGLQASLRGNLKSDLQYQVGYTYSHTNDAGSQGSSAGDLGTISNPYVGWKYDFGPSAFDIHHIFFTNFVYEIPLFKNSGRALKTALGGWELSGIVSVQSGAPLNIGLNTPNITNVIPSYGQNLNRPDRTGTGHDPHTVNEWFDTSVFTAPAPGTWGNTPRSSVRGPGRDNWNLSLFKKFNVREKFRFELRAEAYNAFNHTQFSGVDTTITFNPATGLNTRASTGNITSARDPRIMQMALRLNF